MGKRFLVRAVEEAATNGFNHRAEDIQKEIMESYLPGKGSCDVCVFYRNEHNLYCLRQRDCYPETRVLWRKRVEGKSYGLVQPNMILAKF